MFLVNYYNPDLFGWNQYKIIPYYIFGTLGIFTKN